MNDSLGDRMKAYEDAYRIKLIKRAPKIIRIDGKAFHTFLKNADKPFDSLVMTAMRKAAEFVIKEIGGVARFAYLQSDECSILINDALTIETQPWFDNNLQKLVSVAASAFTVGFQSLYDVPAMFDARAFVLPDIDEVINYFIWRQNDATRNSIRMYASSYFPHSELEGVNNEQAQEMMFKVHGYNWSQDSQTWTKRGFVVTKRGVDLEIPQFTKDREYIKKLYLPNDDET